VACTMLSQEGVEMSKLIGSVVAVALVFLLAQPTRDRFAKYKAIEAYEIRPGILVMPTYSADGQVCEIGLERLHYSPEVIRLDSSLSRKDIDQIFEELVPDYERGPKPENPIEQILGGGISGHAMTSAEQYQNVSIYIYGSLSGGEFDDSKAPATLDEVVATVKWKNRKCQ
jgi:hypothetical protein